MSFNPSYRCTLTGDLMVDPVVDREGNSYERAAIEVCFVYFEVISSIQTLTFLSILYVALDI